MPKINVTSDTFPNIVMAYLYDKFIHPDEVSKGNELFNETIDKIKKKGSLPLLRDYYLKMDANDRMKYKLIKDAFEEVTTSNAVIQVLPKKFEKKPEGKRKEGFIKKTIKKIIKTLVASNEFSQDELDLLKEALQYEEEDNG